MKLSLRARFGAWLLDLSSTPGGDDGWAHIDRVRDCDYACECPICRRMTGWYNRVLLRLALVIALLLLLVCAALATLIIAARSC